MHKTIKILPEVLSREVTGETVLLDLDSECYFGLDEVGTRIWQLIREHGDLEKVYAIMLDEFDVQAEQLEKDLDALVRKLADNGLIEIVGDQADSQG